MKNSIFNLFIIFFASNFIFVSCGKHDNDNDTHVFSEEETIETQKHINRYLHKEIIPRIQPAWSKLSDSSKAVTYEYNYIKSGDRWILNDMRKHSSSLSPQNDSLALSIMTNAVKGTVLSQMKGQEKDSSFTLYWTWPVPFPEGTFDESKGEFVALQNTGGGSTGGCDGHGTVANCYTCLKMKCEKVCVGYKNCKAIPNDCTSTHKCASGGPFGKIGGVIIQ